MVFVCIEILINCSDWPHFGHSEISLWVPKFMLCSSPFPTRTDWFKLTNTKCVFCDSWTNKSFNVLIRQPQTILYLEKKEKLTIMPLIMWGCQGSSGVTVSFKKPYLLTSTHSTQICVKSLNIWSGAGAGTCCSKRHLNSFKWPLKWTWRQTWANFCMSI